MTSPPPFPQEWTSEDTAALLTRNIPLTSESPPRIANRPRRAQVAVRKNNQLPTHNNAHTDQYNVTQRRDASDTVTTQQKGGTISSPRKVVKKLCLGTTYGPEWRISDWEKVRPSHSRKAVRSRLRLSPVKNLPRATRRSLTTIQVLADVKPIEPDRETHISHEISIELPCAPMCDDATILRDFIKRSHPSDANLDHLVQPVSHFSDDDDDSSASEHNDMTSPLRMTALTEKDPNSPISLQSTVDDMTNDTADGQKPKDNPLRRSTRTITKVDLYPVVDVSTRAKAPIKRRPNKINATPELLPMTIRHTNGNKGDSVLPKLRLMALAAALEEAEQSGPVAARTRQASRKNVCWAATIAHMDDGTTRSDTDDHVSGQNTQDSAQNLDETHCDTSSSLTPEVTMVLLRPSRIATPVKPSKGAATTAARTRSAAKHVINRHSPIKVTAPSPEAAEMQTVSEIANEVVDTLFDDTENVPILQLPTTPTKMSPIKQALSAPSMTSPAKAMRATRSPLTTSWRDSPTKSMTGLAATPLKLPASPVKAALTQASTPLRASPRRPTRFDIMPDVQSFHTLQPPVLSSMPNLKSPARRRAVPKMDVYGDGTSADRPPVLNLSSPAKRPFRKL